MPSYNKVLLMGHLTRDPQLKNVGSNAVVVEFGIAVNRRFKNAQGEEKEEVAFVDCAAWNRTGEVINEYFSKGKPIFVEGRLKFDTWDDQQSGSKRSKLTVTVESFQFVGDARGADEQSDAAPPPQRRSQSQPRAPQRQQQGGGGYSRRPQRERRPAPDNPIGEGQEFKEEDIPF